MSDLFAALTHTERHTLARLMNAATEMLFEEAKALRDCPALIEADYTSRRGADPYVMWVNASSDANAILNELTIPGYESPVWTDLTTA